MEREGERDRGGGRTGRAVRAMAAAGAAPLVLGAAAAWTLDPFGRLVATDAAIQYAAVALAFLGAAHWGAALASGAGDARRRLAWSAAPALAAWLATQLVPAAGLCVLAAGFAAVWIWDARAAAGGRLPPWYASARRWPTLAVLLALAALLARVMVR